MMKRVWLIIGIGSLICAVFAAILEFAEILTNEQYKTAFLICSIIWFVAAWLWISGKKEKASEI